MKTVNVYLVPQSELRGSWLSYRNPIRGRIASNWLHCWYVCAVSRIHSARFSTYTCTHKRTHTTHNSNSSIEHVSFVCASRASNVPIWNRCSCYLFNALQKNLLGSVRVSHPVQRTLCAFQRTLTYLLVIEVIATNPANLHHLSWSQCTFTALLTHLDVVS